MDRAASVRRGAAFVQRNRGRNQAAARPARLAHFRSRARALNNRAVFEIPDLLEALIAAAPGEAESAAAFQALA